jgi:cell division protein FtsN|tara:strand:+ start:471 stop:1067 length:597 start_codon:yes stop_codon:yes gene_type:complete
MANYPDRKKAVSSRRAPARSKTYAAKLMMIGFGLGYIFSWFCSPVLVINWFQVHFGQSSVVKNSDVDIAVLPKPKFEFYTLLAQEKAQTPKQQTPPPVAKPAPLVAAPVLASTVNINQHQSYYVLQVASFQRREDAEQMLAGLVMRGFDANIKTISQQGTAWHRVMLGPFTSKIQAEKTQGAIAQSERISGIIRRMES